MSISSTFLAIGEPFAAGMFEQPFATYQTRFARAFRRLIDMSDAPDYTGGRLYPASAPLWHLKGAACAYHYSNTFSCKTAALNEKLNEYFKGVFADCKDVREKELAETEREAAFRAVYELDFLAQHNPIPPLFGIGGRGWTHAVMDYESALAKGLDGVRDIIDAHEAENPDFQSAEREVLDALVRFVGRCQAKLAESNAPAELQKAFAQVPLHGARSFYEAILAYNIFWYIEAADSAGTIDKILAPYLKPTDNPEPLFREFWLNFDRCDGWHVTLDCKSPLAIPAIKAQRGIRRPNSGILIDDDTPAAFWNAIFDNWAAGTPCPSLYSRKNYIAAVCPALSLPLSDTDKICHAGCTELMIQGRSHNGSIEAGLNTIEVLAAMNPEDFADFQSFKTHFVDTIDRKLDEICDSARRYREYIAKWRPNPLRTLFYRNCLETSRDFNDFGTTYNASIINIAGLTNVVNSLVALRRAFDGKLSLTVPQLMAALRENFPQPEVQTELKKLPKFGNGLTEADDIAKELSDNIFQRILSHSDDKLKMLPSVILFVTYTGLGSFVPATPDGRHAGEAIADSCGAMQGTDTNGPTALLLSTSTPDLSKAIGTPVFNVRLAKSLLADAESRSKVQALLMTYFNRGGMQLQVTVQDAETLRKALAEPEKYPELIVRIGGYSEYFQRLGHALQAEVVKRTEQQL